MISKLWIRHSDWVLFWLANLYASMRTQTKVGEQPQYVRLVAHISSPSWSCITELYWWMNFFVDDVAAILDALLTNNADSLFLATFSDWCTPPWPWSPFKSRTAFGLLWVNSGRRWMDSSQGCTVLYRYIMQEISDIQIPISRRRTARWRWGCHANIYLYIMLICLANIHSATI